MNFNYEKENNFRNLLSKKYVSAQHFYYQFNKVWSNGCQWRKFVSLDDTLEKILGAAI